MKGGHRVLHRDYIRVPTKHLKKNHPCPFGRPVILTVVDMAPIGIYIVGI